MKPKPPGKAGSNRLRVKRQATGLLGQRRSKAVRNARSTLPKSAQDARLWLSALVKSSDDAILSKTLDGVITSWNPAAQRLYGYRAEEIIGQPVSLLLPPERRDEFNQLMRRLRQGERIEPFETVRVGRDGRRIEVAVTISPIINAQGQILGASTIARDITGRKEAEIERVRLLKEVEGSRQRFQRIAETSPDALYIYNFDTGRILYVSSRSEEIIGYSAEQVKTLGARFASTLWHSDDVRGLPEHRRKLQALADGEIYENEYRLLHPDGAYRWLHSRSSVFSRATDGHILEIISVTQDVTERKHTQEQLVYHALVLENVHDAIVAADERLCLTAWNRAAEQMYGYTAAEVLGRDIRDVVRSDYDPDQRASDYRTLAEAGYLRAEAIHHRKDSTAFNIEGAIIALRNKTGAVTGYIYAFRDITERKRSEEALRASEERFRHYFEFGLIGLAITSPTKGFLEVNDEICRILGYERDELLQMTWAEMTHPDDLATDWAQFNQALAGEIDGYSLDKHWIRKDGRVIYSTIAVKCVRQADGAVDYFVALLQDITERKQAEIEREQLLSELQASRYLAQRITETSPDALSIFDVDSGQTIYISAQSEQVLGYSPQQVLALGAQFAETLWHPDDLPARNELRGNLQGLADKAIYEFEHRLLQPDDTYRWLGVRASIFARDDAGKVRQVVGVTQDISEHKQAVAELVALKNRLAAELSAMTRLHELESQFLATAELQPLLEEALAATIALQGADFGNIQHYNPQRSALEIIAQQGFDQAFLDYFSRVDDDHAACGSAIQQAERVIIEDVETDAGFAPHRAIAAATGFRAVQSTPLFDRGGQLLGVFSTHFRQPHRPTEHELQLTDLYTRQIADMMGFNVAQERLQQAHDELEARVVERTGEVAKSNAELRVEIAERRRVEEELRKLALLVENSKDFVGMALPDGQTLFVNPAGQDLLGIEGDKHLRTTCLQDFVAEIDRERFQNDVLPTVLRTGRWSGEIHFRHCKSGAAIPMWQDIFFVAEPERDPNLILGVISRDIRTHKRVERAQQDMLGQLVRAQEEERRRIAHELHDSLGQYLTALDLGLKAGQALDGCPPTVMESIQKARDLALRIDDEMERLAFELRPPALDDLGLEDALRRHVQQWSATSGITVDLHTGGLDQERLPPFVETTIYRIVQEALTNILKHAAASRVSLIIERRRSKVLTIIEDDGRGFDVEAVQQTSRRFGLKNMAERAALAGGRLDIETEPGAGVTLYVHLPLQMAQLWQ